jgi:saccharopine dehydrogenase (NAD+, L-lysine-forming)
LIDAGYTLHIERSPERIFDDEEFEKIGAKLVPEFSWPEAPADHIIVGLKELPEENCESIPVPPIGRHPTGNNLELED